MTVCYTKLLLMSTNSNHYNYWTNIGDPVVQMFARAYKLKKRMATNWVSCKLRNKASAITPGKLIQCRLMTPFCVERWNGSYEFICKKCMAAIIENVSK